MGNAIKDHFAGHYQTFYARYLPNIQRATGDELKAICPFHPDTNPSLSFNVQNGLFKCYGCDAGGSIFDFYAKQNGIDTRKDFKKILDGIARDFNIYNGNESQQAATPIVTARYEYRDESGSLAYEIERLEPKSFRIRRPDGNGGWIYQKGDVRIIPYRLPEILKATEIIVAEGEKDADTLAALGFTTTTNPFGAGKWPDRFGPYFSGKSVVLIPDNDEPGRAHMRQVAANLKGHAASIRWLDLPGLSEKGDVSDWLIPFQDKEEAAERLSVSVSGSDDGTSCYRIRDRQRR
jgi:DNA primase